MKTSDFYYDLPKELIAQDPLEDRSASRLMHLDKTTGEYKHGHFRDILQYLKPGDCLVINDTKVIPARLYGSKVGTDAAIEILLLKRKENDIWETLVKPGKKCKVGTVISFGDGILTGEVVDIVDEGNRLIQFHYDGIFEEILTSLARCRCRRISHTNCRTRTAIRRYTRNTREAQPLRPQDCILRMSFCSRYRMPV